MTALSITTLIIMGSFAALKMTLGIISRMTLSITILNSECRYAEHHSC
jgi:hypothetical protein